VSAGALPELAGVPWRRRASERSLRARGRTWTLTTAAHVVPFVATAALLVAIKLVLQPLLAWVLATKVFFLSPLLTHCAVLIAALPTGTGPFMLAELFRREAEVTATVILVSTVLSIVTITAYLAIAGTAG